MIKVILKPKKGIQIDETKKYLFDPSVVQPYVDASAENATKAEEQANRAEQVFTDVTVFVDNSKTEINGIIEQGKTEIATAIDDGRMEISDSILEATEDVKKAGQEAAQEAVQGAADEATRIATEQVNTYVVEVVSPQIQEFVNNAEADASNAAESAGLAAEEANKSSVFASDSQHYAEDARIWAEGFDSEVKNVDGEHSSKVWSEMAKTSANNAQASATRSENAAVRADEAITITNTNVTKINNIVENAVEELSKNLNNPFSLLDYKWSEYELSNASWLISNGTFHSGTVYKAVYELLLKIKNGAETKDGVSVKLTTEAYSNTDFVLNTSNTTFRLPINVKLASGNAVVGNGKVLGLTNGEANFSLATRKTTIQGYDYALMAGAVGIYGQSAGSTDITSWRNVSEGVGVTKSEKNSGIETSSSGLKLYFYVGETIQDANIIVASQVLTEISKKTDKVQAAEASMPSTKYIDLTLGSSGTTYTAPANGWVVFGKAASGAGQYINLSSGYTTNQVVSNASGNILSIYIPVYKGKTFKANYSAGGATNSFRFIYAKGEE